MKLTAGLRLTDAWQQCQRHVHHLNHALHALGPMLPVSASALTGLSDEQVQDWDQFILRFTKLQDAMGSRLFPAVLTYLQEPFEDRPMLDKLHRLEKLGYLSSVQSWQNWRAIRNSFAHDYPEDNALKAGYLNLATDIVPELLDTLDRIAPIVDAANA